MFPFQFLTSICVRSQVEIPKGKQKSNRLQLKIYCFTISITMARRSVIVIVLIAPSELSTPETIRYAAWTNQLKSGITGPLQARAGQTNSLGSRVGRSTSLWHTNSCTTLHTRLNYHSLEGHMRHTGKSSLTMECLNSMIFLLQGILSLLLDIWKFHWTFGNSERTCAHGIVRKVLY